MSDSTCKELGCEKSVLARGWCSPHYQRWRATGSPLPPAKPDGRELLWARIKVGSDDECWPWIGPLDRNGYGHSTPAGFPAYAHRAAFQDRVGPLLPDEDGTPLVIDHACHDPETCKLSKACPHRRCCNPKHLKLVRRSENVVKDRAFSRGAQKTHCPKGHPYTEENTYVYTKRTGGKSRFCRTCLREANKISKAKRRARENGAKE